MDPQRGQFRRHPLVEEASRGLAQQSSHLAPRVLHQLFVSVDVKRQLGLQAAGVAILSRLGLEL